ncbi:MAG: ParB/RepB/Spo0J family partition protein [Thermodesulfobacteriota bacterium]|nr:ParB/RepB/Spo0J family partition protein [Thermodesulfobacteriota bacterium]
MQKKGPAKKDKEQPREPKKKRALGRGLDALFPEISRADAAGGDYFYCDLDVISSNRFQPRSRFSEEELAALAESIKKEGVIQPVIVRKTDTGYELVAGERRLRAARLAGLSQVPAVVREISDQQHLVYSIVENVQREDLNPLEEAQGYHMLVSTFGFSQEEVAAAVGKNRSTVANMLRLRNLPDAIKERIADGSISTGHARALLAAKTPQQQNAIFQAILARGLSVRQAEAMVKAPDKAGASPSTAPLKKPAPADAAHFTDMAESLARTFGTRVRIQRKGRRGKIEIEFYSDADLDRVLELLLNI